MLLNVTENLQLAAPGQEVWRLLRDTQRLASLVPGVDAVEPITGAPDEAYRATVTEKVGPFKVTMKIEVTITETVDNSILKASVKGADTAGLSRTTGTLQVDLTSVENATAMRLEIAVEVLGKLATLGATVIRRRFNEVFSQFGQRIVAQFPVAQP